MTAEQPSGSDSEVDGLDDIELRRHVAKLSATVRALAGTVARLAGTDPAGAERPAADATDAPRAVDGEGLVTWVQWLVTHYELDNIPDCWTHHGALVEELDALRIGWHSTIGRGQTGLAAMQWHDYFGRTLDRLDRRWRTRCDDGHRTATLPAWITKDTDTLDAPDLNSGRYVP